MAKIVELNTGAVCGECGHIHSGPCPDHCWTDACPYVGTECPPEEERARITAELQAQQAGRWSW